MKEPVAITVQLVHIHGPMKGTIQEFSGNEIAIGRHPACELHFPKDLVVISRRHASIVRDGNRFKIVDHSTNGTFVNGEKITEAYLKNGDVIIFTQGGPKVSFLTRVGEPMEKTDAPPARSTSRINSMAHEPPAEPQFHPEPPSQPLRSDHEPQIDTPNKRVKAPLVIQYGAILQSFSELPVTIGTHESCDLTLSHPSLSERHVQFVFSRGRYMVKDLTGRGQLRINDQPIVSPSPIAPEDTLFLTPAGPAFQFMEGGRMAEINIPQKDELKSTNQAEDREKEEPSKKKPGSLFKKFFNG